MQLSVQQQQAADHIDGPALVLSVPGSGKTTVLLERIRRLQAAGIDPSRILTVTFSRVQAEDMRLRFGEDTDVSFFTIHSFCYQLVRGWLRAKNRQRRVIEGKGFNKYDLLRRLCIERYGRPIAKEETEEFFRIYGYLTNTRAESMKDCDEFYRTLLTDYDEAKRAHHFIDFDDMLTLCLHILETEPSWLKRLRGRFPYVQLDEGQDTSRLQMDILRLIAAPNNNLFVLADDDQSIYAFRGADAQALLQFSAWYDDPSFYYLEHNYRSTPGILESASRVIANNTVRYKKTLRPVKEPAGPVVHKIVPNLKKQLQVLLRAARADDGKITAILYRNRVSGLPVAAMLAKHGIPYTVRHAWDDIRTHPIVRDVFSFLRLAENPLDADAFLSVYYKIGAYISKEQALLASEAGDHRSVWDALAALGDLPDWRADQLRGVSKKWSRLRRMPFAKRIAYIESELNYGDYVREWARRQTFSDNTGQLIDILKAFSAQAESAEELSSLLSPKSADGNGTVVLSTIHGSKGLEYDRVFLIDLVQAEFPGNYGDDPDEIAVLEEERRLFYVGMTRAKEELTLISLAHRNERSCEPSQFIQEIKR